MPLIIAAEESVNYFRSKFSAMFRYVFPLVMMVHGMVHFIGYANGYNYRFIPILTKSISPKMGLFWLIAAFLFIGAAVLLLMDNMLWWKIALLAAAFSQLLIFFAWEDAKFGTVANLLIVACIVAVLV